MGDFVYNIPNDNENDTWEKQVGGQSVTGEVVERIDLTNLEYVTVPGCKHERTEIDPTEDTDHYFGVKCQDCPIGWLVKKSTE